jgi:hypothetical protein
MCQSVDEDLELQEAIRLSLEQQQQLVLDEDCGPQLVSSSPPCPRFSVLCIIVVNILIHLLPLDTSVACISCVWSEMSL